MQRNLPIAVVAGIDFYIDAEREELRQVSRPANRISFNAIRSSRQGYRFLYNQKQACPA